MTQYNSKRRDYYREYVKELIPLKKPFLVTGTYAPPRTSEEAYFCQFWNIEPYVFGAIPEILCSHIHITRELAERAYQQRFTRDMQGQKFVLCVKPYIYEGNRGGLELTTELEEWIEPIFPLNWYNSPLEALARIPEDRVLDFRFIPRRQHYLESIVSYQHVKDRARFLAPKPERKVQQKHKHLAYDPSPDESFEPEEGRPTVEQLEKKIDGIMGLSKKKSGMMSLAAQGIFFGSASSRLDWLLEEMRPWKWSEWEAMHFLKRIDVTPEKFMKLKKKSFRVWCRENCT